MKWVRHLRVLRLIRQVGEALAQEGELILGLVVMRNRLLGGHEAVAPALILGSFDFSVAGMDVLDGVYDRFHALGDHADPAIRNAIHQIFEDEDYRPFRRRELPACVAAPRHIVLFDEFMRGDDFFEAELEDKPGPLPFVAMFANRNAPQVFSLVIPGKISRMVLEFLVGERKKSAAPAVPPPLPSQRNTTAPPLP